MSRGFAALRVRNYRLFWCGQLVSLVGTWMQQVSLPWLVLALGGTPIQLGVVLAFQLGPSMVLAPFAGVLVDRLDKRRTLILAQSAAATQALVLFGLTASGRIEIWMVMILGLVLGVVTAFELPTRHALSADLVPRNLLANALALNSVTMNAGRVVGPALAGVIIAAATTATGSATAGVAINLGINVLTFAGVLVALLRMDVRQIRRVDNVPGHASVFSSLKEGVAHALRTPLVLWPLVLLGGIIAFGYNFPILLPLVSTEVLHLGAEGYGALFAAWGAGTLLGAVTLAFMRQRKVIPLVLGGGTVLALLLAGIGLVRDALLTGVLVLAAGYASMVVLNTINVTVQANVADPLRGRVMSLYVTVFAGSTPIGGLILGAVAQAWGSSVAFLAAGALTAATVAVVALGLHRATVANGVLGATTVGTASGAGHG